MQCLVPQEEDPEKYQAHFSAFIAEELEADDLEDMYKGVRLGSELQLCTAVASAHAAAQTEQPLPP